MRKAKIDKPPTRARWIVKMLIGVVLMGCAVAIPLTMPVMTWKDWTAVAILAAFAIQDFWAARNVRTSWLETLGPLP